MTSHQSQHKAALLTRGGDSLLSFLWAASGFHQVALCALGLLVALLTIAPIELHRRLVDDVIVQEQVDLLFGLGVAYLVLILTKAGVKYGFQIYQGWVIERAALTLRRQLVAHAEDQRAAGAQARDGAAVTVIGAETDKLAGFVGEALSLTVLNVGMLAAVGAYMLAEQWLIGLVALSILIPQVVVVPLIQRRVNRLIERRLALLRGLGEEVTELCGEDHGTVKRDLDGTAVRVYCNRIRIYAWKFFSKAFVNLMNNLAPGVLLVFGGFLAIQGETTLGVLVAFLSGLERISDPLRDLVTHYREIAQASVQHKKLRDWAFG